MRFVYNLLTGIAIILAIATIFVFQSLTVDVAERKGYNKLKASLIGLIPVFGLIYYLKKPIIRYGMTLRGVRHVLRFRAILQKYIVYMELIIVAIIVLIPITYAVGASLNNTSALPTTIWPKNGITFRNFQDLIWGKDVFEKGNFAANLKSLIWGNNKNYARSDNEPLTYTFRNLFQLKYRSNFITWFLNTLGIALVNMILGVICITGAAYVFARFKFKGKRVGLVTIMVLQAFPSFMGLIAMYILFETFGLLGRPLALSILYIGGSIPYNLWVIRGYLMNVPKDLDESAMIDGANKVQIFSRIILPLSVPIISFVAVNLFISPWMDYMLPGFILRPQIGTRQAEKQWTVAVGLFSLISGQNSEYTTFAAGSVLIGLPITILYMIFQRYLVEGITAGSTKG